MLPRLSSYRHFLHIMLSRKMLVIYGYNRYPSGHKGPYFNMTTMVRMESKYGLNSGSNFSTQTRHTYLTDLYAMC